MVQYAAIIHKRNKPRSQNILNSKPIWAIKKFHRIEFFNLNILKLTIHESEPNSRMNKFGKKREGTTDDDEKKMGTKKLNNVITFNFTYKWNLLIDFTDRIYLLGLHVHQWSWLNTQRELSLSLRTLTICKK